MSNYVLYNGELYHHGVKGMRWGIRKDRITVRQASKNARKAYKEEYMNTTKAAGGKAISKFGITVAAHPNLKAKYQAKAAGRKAARESYERDVQASKAVKAKQKNPTKGWSEDAKDAAKIKNKTVKAMSNAELKRLNERSRLEQEYSRLNPSKVAKGIKFVEVAAAATGTALTIYNNADKIVKIGKSVAEKMFKK